MVIYWNSNVNILIFWETGFLTFIKIKKIKKTFEAFYFTCKESKIYESVTFWNVTRKKRTFSRYSFFFLDVPLYQTAQKNNIENLVAVDWIVPKFKKVLYPKITKAKDYSLHNSNEWRLTREKSIAQWLLFLSSGDFIYISYSSRFSINNMSASNKPQREVVRYSQTPLAASHLSNKAFPNSLSCCCVFVQALWFFESVLYPAKCTVNCSLILFSLFPYSSLSYCLKWIIILCKSGTEHWIKSIISLGAYKLQINIPMFLQDKILRI